MSGRRKITGGTNDTATRDWRAVAEGLQKECAFLERALFGAAEREQRRIGQELHDHLCQQLLGAAFSATAIADTATDARAAGQLRDLAHLINDAVKQVRELCRGLHPVEIDPSSLMSALQELAGHTSRSIPCVFHCPNTALVSDPNMALHAFRIAQEAVNCLLRATKAKNITITLEACGGARLRLTILADGTRESELTSQPAGTVAKILQYRARAMRGKLSTAYQPEVGTTIVCKFPTKPEETSGPRKNLLPA